jgi:hypothetical protein
MLAGAIRSPGGMPSVSRSPNPRVGSTLAATDIGAQRRAYQTVAGFVEAVSAGIGRCDQAATRRCSCHAEKPSSTGAAP